MPSKGIFMKKIVCLILLLASIFLLAACKEEKYPPVASTDEEKETVMTISFEGEKYDVRYELYRALFLTLKESVDGNDDSVWSGENKDKYINEIDTLIKERVSEIYSAFHLCKKLGINVYSKKFEQNISTLIKASIEGGNIDSSSIEGFGGDYDAYLESLKKMNLNYSVQTLLIRYSLALSAIEDHYAGTVGNGQYVEDGVLGKLEYTKEDIREFYDSSECVRVIRAFLPMEYFSRERAEEIRDKIDDKNGEEEVANYMISVSLEAANLKNGILITKHSLDRQYYGEMIDAAFALGAFETSEVIEIVTGISDGYVILYRPIKSDEFFDNCYDDVVSVYIQHMIGKKLDTVAADIQETIKETSVLKELDRAKISMGSIE